MEDLTEKSGNLKNSEAKFEKWNNLSPKLKLECMKSLDFKTRCNLRSTSKTEKSLADFQKFKINEVLINPDEKKIEITQNGVLFKRKYAERDQFMRLYEYIFRHGILENLIIDGYDSQLFSNSIDPYFVKNLEINFNYLSEIRSCMEKMSDKLKSVTLNGRVSFEDIALIPEIMDVRSLTINFSYQKEAETDMAAEFWIKNDAEIGKKFCVMPAKSGSFEKFSEHFSERLLFKSENFVRIETDNPGKHILLEVNDDFYAGSRLYRENLQMTVIPASFGDDYSKLFQEIKDEVENPEDLIITAYQLEKWNELPEEMKMECIEWLDIGTRMNLRSTSKTEKALVDSKKFEIDEAKIDLDDHSVCIYDYDAWINKHFESTKELIESCKYFLEHGKIENLEISFVKCEHIANLFHDPISPYSVKNLKFDLYGHEYEENIVFFLDKMSNKLESLKIEISTINLSRLDVMFASSKISNIPFIKIDGIQNNDSAEKLAQIWIEKDAKIGNKYQVLEEKTGVFEAFSQHFKDRVVFKTDKFVRIKTDNPSKHILLQIGHSDYGYLEGTEEFLQMTVIPSELKKYDISEEWIREWENECGHEEDDSDSDYNYRHPEFDYYGSDRDDSDWEY